MDATALQARHQWRLSSGERSPLHRYLAEFDFGYNNRTGLGVNDTERAELAIKGMVVKRLTYRRINEAGHA
ncbi:MAG: hypothetical protein H0T56_01300 [Pseudaminobacter sp.]|nr:hypothetical protein [Pseudaminobacter sp.]